MKKLFLALLLSAITLSSFGQSAPIYVGFKSPGGHTTWASGGYQNWPGSATTYTAVAGVNSYKFQYDTISNKDTSRGLNNPALTKKLGNAFSQSLPNTVRDSVQLTTSYRSGSVQLTITKVSGTVVDTAWLLVSDDGLNWIPSGQDTAIFTNVSYTQKYVWELPGRQRVTNSAGTNIVQDYFNTKPDALPYQFYMIYVRGLSSTQSAIVKATGIFRQ